jgi:outer membrane protein TolC
MKHVVTCCFKFERVRFVIALCMWVCLGASAFGVALEPSELLEYRSDAYGRAEVDLEEAQDNLRNATSGFDSFIELKPTVSYGNDDLRNPASDTEFDYGLEIDTGFGYAVDWPEINRVQRRNLIRAEANLADRLREDIGDALEFYVGVLGLQQANLADIAEVVRLEAEFDNAQAQFDAGEISANDLEGVRIDLDAARLDEVTTERDLMLARQRIRDDYGITDTTAMFVPVEFVLPIVPVEETFAYREAALNLRRLEQLALQESYLGILDEIQLQVSYERDQLRDASVSVGINDDGVPNAGIDIDYRPFDDNDDESWEISLGATIRLDTNTGRDFRNANRNIEEAEDDLRRIKEEYAEDVPNVLEDAVTARRELELAVENLAFIEQRIVELQAQFEAESSAFTLADSEFSRLNEELAAIEDELNSVETRRDEIRAERDATEDEAERDQLQAEDDALNARRGELLAARDSTRDARGDVEVDRRNLERALQGTERDLNNLVGRDRDRAEGDMFNRFRDYMRRVEDYLELVDAPWAIIGVDMSDLMDGGSMMDDSNMDEDTSSMEAMEAVEAVEATEATEAMSANEDTGEDTGEGTGEDTGEDIDEDAGEASSNSED